MAGVTVTATLHSGFTVTDAQRTAAFFRDCLGFEAAPPREAPAGALAPVVGIDDAQALIIYVSAPGHMIELLEYRRPGSLTSAAPRPCDIGFAHLAFLVDDVAAMVQKASGFGFRPARDIGHIPSGPHAGRRVVYLRDADGFTVELMGG